MDKDALQDKEHQIGEPIRDGQPFDKVHKPVDEARWVWLSLAGILLHRIWINRGFHLVSAQRIATLSVCLELFGCRWVV